MAARFADGTGNSSVSGRVIRRRQPVFADSTRDRRHRGQSAGRCNAIRVLLAEFRSSRCAEDLDCIAIVILSARGEAMDAMLDGLAHGTCDARGRRSSGAPRRACLTRQVKRRSPAGCPEVTRLRVSPPPGSSCRLRRPAGTGSSAWAACRRVPRPADPSCATWREWSCSS